MKFDYNVAIYCLEGLGVTRRRYPPRYCIFLWQKLHRKDIKITFYLLQLSMHSCFEDSSNLSCVHKGNWPRVLVCIIGRRYHGWVLL